MATRIPSILIPSPYVANNHQYYNALEAKEKGVKNFGIHTMIVSNELNREYLAETARMMFELIDEISREVGIRFSFVNFGGGIGVPYRPEEEPVDLEALGEDIRVLYEEADTPQQKQQLRETLQRSMM